MEVVFKTNNSVYKVHFCFPENFEIIPRIGEKIRVRTGTETYCRAEGLPVVLEVVDVEYREALGEMGYFTVAYVSLDYIKENK